MYLYLVLIKRYNMKNQTLLSLLFAGCLFCLIPINLTAQKKALVGGTLIDGFGGTPLQNAVILIEGDKIVKVGTVGSLPVPKDAEVISTEGMSVLPGLWDMHVHLMINGHSNYDHWDKKYPPVFRKIIMPSSAKQLLLAGVTSARDLGAPTEDIIAVRDSINRGFIDGPTLYVSGAFLQHEPYPGTEQFRWGIKGVADARAKVQKLAKAGVDCIKLIDQDLMEMDEVMAVVDEAHKHKLKVVAHSHRPEEIRRGMKAGVDCFEHTGLAMAPEYPEDVLALINARATPIQNSFGAQRWRGFGITITSGIIPKN
jgi:imidazolonepropionase-like amidohydrolase